MSAPAPARHPADDSTVIRSATGVEAERLRREVTMAQRLAGPAVVRVDGHECPSTGAYVAEFDHAPGATAAWWHPTSPEAVAAGFAAAAQALADIHTAGVAHRSVSVHHLVRRRDGRLVLTGLADATEASVGATEADTAALGRALAEVCGRLQSPRRFTATGRATRRLAALARSVADGSPTELRCAGTVAAALARQASAPFPSADGAPGVPPALRSAASPATATPGPRRPPPTDTAGSARSAGGPDRIRAGLPVPTRRWRDRPPRPRPDGRAHGRSLGKMMATIAGVAVVGVAATGAWSPDAQGPSWRSPGHVAQSDPSPGPTDITADATPRPDDPFSHAVASDHASTCGRRAHVDDACHAIEVGPGWVEVAGRHLVVGRAADQLLVGDWDCDGDVTLAVVTAADGAVHVFDRWDLDGPVIAEVAAVLTEASHAEVISTGGGCDDLVVVHPGGRWQLNGTAT